MANEHSIDSARQGARKSILEALGKSWAPHCTAEGRKRLLDAIEYCYWQRNSQLAGYPKSWGDAARPYIVKVWATADDNRIERMTRETYGRGYFALDELKPSTRTALAEMLKGERVMAKPCAG